MKDTYNLLSDGIVKLVRALSEVGRSDLPAARGYERYVGSSVKGDACIDWDDKKARAALLGRIVGQTPIGCWSLSRRTQELLDEDSTERQRIVEASELLGQLLLQDVERTEEWVGLKEGVSRDRIVSVHDPEMRHGITKAAASGSTDGVGGSGHRLTGDHGCGRAPRQRFR